MTWLSFLLPQVVKRDVVRYGQTMCGVVWRGVDIRTQRTCRIAPYLPKMSYISSAEILKGRFLEGIERKTSRRVSLFGTGGDGGSLARRVSDRHDTMRGWHTRNNWIRVAENA